MLRNLIYGSGLAIALVVVVILVYLTLVNLFSGEAFYAGRDGPSVHVVGPSSAPVNAGILSWVVWFLSYVGYLRCRSVFLQRLSQVAGLAGVICISVGLAWAYA